MEELKSQKRKNSNNARLESIKRQKSLKAMQTKQISKALNNLDSSIIKNKKIVFDTDLTADEEKYNNNEISNNNNKVALFESSDTEEVNENYDDSFKIKKQFEGRKGKELFLRSFECSDERFKFDERFEEIEQEDESLEKQDEAEVEKAKNFEILEKVLGFQVPRKTELAKTKKKYVRFDPESENASNYIEKQPEKDVYKKQEAKENKKNIYNKEKGDEKRREEKSSVKKNTDIPVVSTERFFEVAENLKELLAPPSQSDGHFSLGTKFQQLERDEIDEENELHSPIETCENTFSDVSSRTKDNFSEVNDFSGNIYEENLNSEENDTNISSVNPLEKRKMFFFMQQDDKRLKEGINFFHWSKPLDDVRKQWSTTRNELLEAYKKNRKIRPSVSKHRTSKNFQKRKQFYK